MRVDRWFAFVDLSGFTAFTDGEGDEAAVAMLTRFRAVVRETATDFSVRIAKWLGDGCMLVSVEPDDVVAAVCHLEQAVDDLHMPLSLHAGCAGGPVILLEGDDYTGRAVNLAARLAAVAPTHEVYAPADLAPFVPEGWPVEPAGVITVPGFQDPIEVVRFGCGRGTGTVRA